jgi:DNA-binding FadR family transcriptional regulator
MVNNRDSFNFVEYIADDTNCCEEDGRFPSLTKLSKESGVSISRLREQLAIAKELGFVEVRPRTGIRRLPYSFTPAVASSLSYAIARERSRFDQFADLRRHVEACYWKQAVQLLEPEDHQLLRDLVDSAWSKLEGNPVRLPHREHRQLHLLIFGRLENPFVSGILEAYWDAYEKVGYNRYHGLDYLQRVWKFHDQIVKNICIGEIEAGYRALLKHMELLHLIP